MSQRLLLLLVLWLTACTATPPQPASDWEAHRAALLALDSWQFSGRIAVQTDSGADSASIEWHQAREDLDLVLSGPMGIKEARLEQRAGRLVLLRDGERVELPPGDDPLVREFGWSLPLDYLPFWLRGVPAPGYPVEARELDRGRLARLRQAGWTLIYTDYQQVGQMSLPRRIRFSRETVNGKILLKEWTL